MLVEDRKLGISSLVFVSGYDQTRSDSHSGLYFSYENDVSNCRNV